MSNLTFHHALSLSVCDRVGLCYQGCMNWEDQWLTLLTTTILLQWIVESVLERIQSGFYAQVTKYEDLVWTLTSTVLPTVVPLFFHLPSAQPLCLNMVVVTKIGLIRAQARMWEAFHYSRPDDFFISNQRSSMFIHFISTHYPSWFWVVLSFCTLKVILPQINDSMKLLSSFIALFLAISAFAIPSPSLVHYAQLSKRNILYNTVKPKLVLPDNQTSLTPPVGDASFVLLGVGYQNYTCAGDKYTWVYINDFMPILSLFDCSVLQGRWPSSSICHVCQRRTPRFSIRAKTLLSTCFPSL